MHLGEYETTEAALAAWLSEIAEHRRTNRDERAEKLQDKLNRLQELTEGANLTPT